MRSPTNVGEIKLQQKWDFISFQITCLLTNPRNWSHKIREMQRRRIIWEILLQNLWRRWQRIPSGRLPWKTGEGKLSRLSTKIFVIKQSQEYSIKWLSANRELYTNVIIIWFCGNFQWFWNLSANLDIEARNWTSPTLGMSSFWKIDLYYSSED